MKTYINSTDIFWKLWRQSKILIRCFHWRIRYLIPPSITYMFCLFSSRWPNSICGFFESIFLVKRLKISVFGISPKTSYFSCTMKRVCIAPSFNAGFLTCILSNRVQIFAGSMANTFSRLECDLTFWFCLDLTSFVLIVLNTQRS